MLASKRKEIFVHPLSDFELEEHEEESREEETARQKEFLEKVVVSQKGQLRQLEKVGAGENIALFYQNIPQGAKVEQRKDVAGQQSPAQGDRDAQEGDDGDEEVQGEAASDQE